MKNKLLKLFVAISFSVGIILFATTVKATTFHSIDMDIYIEQNGDAKVTETWSAKTNKGTELYHPYFNLGKSEIKDLTVTKNSTTYTTLNSWNVNASRSEKKDKCGLHKTSDGVEVCWGIGDYGNDIYTVKYTITNFVAELTDAQMIYWQLIPYDFSDEIGHSTIKIHSAKYFQDTVDVWGYGKYGAPCYVHNGAIYMDSDGSLDEDEYMTILVKFAPETFDTSNKLNHDFNYYYEMSIEDAKKYEDDSWMIALFTFGFFGFIFIASIIAVIISERKGNTLIKFGEPGCKMPKDLPYYRDIPLNGDIMQAYFVAQQYRLVKSKNDIIGALILKWLKDDYIAVENNGKNGVFNKKDTVIVLNKEKEVPFKNKTEADIFKMLLEASKDGRLENKEFEKWCSDHYTKILNWFDRALREARTQFVDSGYIEKVEKRGINEYVATDRLKEEAIKIAGLKKYLLEYTLIKDRQSIEVSLFENYLVFAQMLGIADKVAKEFKEIYPDIIERSHYGSYDYIFYINMYSRNGIQSAQTARSLAESYSSGGGGFSSGGGGGGSFGGGGGGGGCR